MLISTGEVSGDVIGALVTRAIHAQRPDAVVFGIGGPRMEEAGAVVRFRSSHLGTAGITEAFRKLPAFVRAWAIARTIVRNDRPDVAVLIGNDLFHVLLARWLRFRGIRTVAYFPPQIWVWRSLLRPIARSFDTVLTSFPDEQTVYERASRGTHVIFVGHYLCDLLTRRTAASIHGARERLALSHGSRVIVVMPGSRGHEIRDLLPTLVHAARLLLDSDPTLACLIPVAENGFRSEIERELARAGASDRVRMLDGSSHDAMVAADLVILASGTASLEATLLGVPMVIVYKLSMLTAGIVRVCIRLGLIDSDIVGLPNLILGRRAVPELLQRRATAPAIAAEAAAILSSPDRQRAIAEALAEAARRISGGGALGHVASHVVALAGPPSHSAPVQGGMADPGTAAASGLKPPLPESE